MQALKQELAAYYAQYRLIDPETQAWSRRPSDDALTVRRAILAEADAELAAHPVWHPSLLKARLHEIIAERFQPVVFRHNPFFFEMGLRFSENWGTPHEPVLHVGSWLHDRRAAILYDTPEWRLIQAGSRGAATGLHLWNIWSSFDADHHCPGYTKLLRVGVVGVLAEIEARGAEPCDGDQAANLEAMARSCRALLRVAARFRAAALDLLPGESDPRCRRFLTMMAEAAGHVPAHPPRTFYEGLAMLWFFREALATLEAIGISVVGHLDRLLIDLYRADLAAGRLTEAEARDLLARWMLPTDVKFHVEDNAWPETSTCMTLGGCDEDGVPVWNELTRLIIDVHREHRLLNPKLNCRVSADAPAEYLHLISETLLAGHNQFALLNDDVLIPACVRAGKTEREARLYVNGGCQETIVEGVEHSAGAYYYFNMPRVLDLCLRPPASKPALPVDAAALLPELIEPPTFAAWYAHVMRALTRAICQGADWARVGGERFWEVHPCPLFSTMLEGCVAAGRDYTRGGAKYNPSGIALCGLATMVDAMYAVRQAVYEDGWLSWEELRAALAANWAGHEATRLRLSRLPKYGQGHPEVDALAARFVDELGAFVATIPNERGGHFQGSFFVYYAFQWFGDTVRATPDGRADGEFLSQGIAPHRRTVIGSITDVLHTLSAIDFRAYQGNAVLDLQLPAGQPISPDALVALIRTFARLGGPTLQPNLVSLDLLHDAQRHPDAHRDLVVRISGLSAHFVCLHKSVQDEIISRAMMGV